MHRSSRTYQDFTGSGIKQFEQTDIYQKATRIGERRVVEDNNRQYPPDFQRRVVRNVEVPYQRQVKVPTRERKLVASMTTMKVPVKKLVEVPSYRIVDEEYTEWEDQEKVRDKEIWVKKIVQEKYVEKVPVKKTRQVRVPHKEIREVEELQDVQVATNRAVEVPGFRVDEVQDSKVVEVEEMEDMRWEAEPTGQHNLVKTEEGPTVPGDPQMRRVGNEFYSYDDPQVRHLELDRYEKPRPASAGLARTMRMGDDFYGKESMATTRYVTRTASQPMRPLDEPITSNANYGWTTTNASYGGNSRPSSAVGNNWLFQKTPVGDPRFNVPQRSAGDLARHVHGEQRRTEAARSNAQKSGGLGITCKTTATPHSNSCGVSVTRVTNDSAAAFAGIREKDVIVQCQGVAISSVEELGQAIRSAGGGQLRMVVNRDGKRHVEVVVQPY